MSCIEYQRVKWGEDCYRPPHPTEEVHFPTNPLFRTAMSIIHGLHNTLSLLTKGDFGGVVVYNPALFPDSKGEGFIIKRNLRDGTFTISEPCRRNLLRLPARLVHNPSSAG